MTNTGISEQSYRRRFDDITGDRLNRLESRIDMMDTFVRNELLSIDTKIKNMMEISSSEIAEKAVDMAVRRAFSHFGVDVDDPKDLQKLRDDIKFGGNFRTILITGMMSIFGAICGAVGVSIWTLFFSHVSGSQ